ncbi:MAG: multiheme c-type cytochrome [Armatimonadota bacterium]
MHRNKKRILWMAGVSMMLAVVVVALEGCGGGGGPLTPPPGVTPSPSTRFTELLPDAQKDASYVGTEQCRGCHGAGSRQGGAEPVAVAWSKTKHASVNVGCEQCHGPGSKHAQAPSKKNILTYPNVASSVVCAQCHGTIGADYEQSGHAGAVEVVIEEAEQNPNFYGKTCFRCHSAPFRAQMVDSKLTYGQTIDQVDAGIQAVSTDSIVQIAHATHESASCVSCHDPHRQTGNLTWQGKEVQLRRAVFNTDTTDVAPGTPVKQHTTFNQICGSCHNGRGGNPSDTALNTGTARPNFHDSNQYNMLMGITGVEEQPGPVVRNNAHATAPGQCSHCHVANARHTFTVSYDTGCSPCHTTADATARSQSTKIQIEQGLLALRSRLEAWSQQTFGDPDLWNYTTLIPTGKTAPPQSQVPIEVKRARHNYWFILRDHSFGVHNGPYARYLLEVANANLDRLGVGGRSRAANLSPAQRRSILEADLQRLKESYRYGVE